MAKDYGFEELVGFVKELGFYEQGYVKGDMEIDRQEYWLKAETTPRSYGFGVSSIRFDLYLQGELDNIDRLAYYRDPGNWPSEDFAIYWKREGRPIAPCGLSDLYLWLIETLDPVKYLEKAQKARWVWDDFRLHGKLPPVDWSRDPYGYAQQRQQDYEHALKHRKALEAYKQVG